MDELTGLVPSKLQQLTALTHLYPADNSLTGCVPPSLRDVSNNDLTTLGLTDCGAPSDISFGEQTRDGSYQFTLVDTPLHFEVPAGLRLEIVGFVVSDAEEGGSSSVGLILRNTAGGSWICLDVGAGGGMQPLGLGLELRDNPAIARPACRVGVDGGVAMRKYIARASTGVVIALLLAVAQGAGSANADAKNADGGEVIVELRVWQDVNDQENLHVSARLQGGRWDAHGTRPVQLHDDESDVGRYRYDTVSVGGVELGIWQRRPQVTSVRLRIEPRFFGIEYEAAEVADGEQDTARLPIFVRACGKECPRQWLKLGAVPLVLDDGHSGSGRYRYGDITVAVSPTPGLLADREYLLALRDPLAGTGGLNWSAGTAVSQWEGVTAEGSPPRVTELRLSGLGLSGEMWGWLGDLTELRELWLDDNPLTGGIPSKLVNLDKLTHLYLGGSLFGCVPPPLLTVPNYHIDVVPDLRPCPSVQRVSGGVGGFGAHGAGIYWSTHPEDGGGIVFDMPVQAWLSVLYELVGMDIDMYELPPGHYWRTCLDVPTVHATILIDFISDAWVAYYEWDDAEAEEECERRVPAELPQYEAVFDQITASLWRSWEAPW